jgi:UDP-2,4-diacetamido-2,4,6-trideoxy-beta-L-altropyranose hydrolase
VGSGNFEAQPHGTRGKQRSSPAAVAIRVDSGAHIGGGQLFRCLTLADELRRRGASVHFVSREHPGHLLARVEDCGYLVQRLPAPRSAESTLADRRAWLGATQDEDARETLAALRGKAVDWLIVDHDGIDAEWEGLVRNAVNRVMVIDDLADRTHDAALLLDQNYFGSDTAHRYERRVPAQCRPLFGPRYALLPPDYRRLRQSLPPRPGTVRRILVFFGAHDPTDAMPRVLHALSHQEFAHVAVDVVVGSDPAVLAEVQSAARARPGITVHGQMPSLADLVARADLAIGACGTTTWERACLGLPAIVVTIADNQVALANALAAADLTVLLGRSTLASGEVWRLVLRQLLKNPERVAALGYRARALTDGHGAGRVARVMLGGNSAVAVRRCNAADEPLLLEWANDLGTRHFAFNKNRIAEDEHHRWFTSRLADPGCMILIGEDSYGLPLGQVRFDISGDSNEATINISVDAALRGTGVGTSLLREAIDAWREDHPRRSIIAEVVLENDVSRRLFSSAGFTPTSSRRPETITFELRAQIRPKLIHATPHPRGSLNGGRSRTV